MTNNQRDAIRRAIDALMFADEKTSELHMEFEGEDSHYAIFDDTITALREVLVSSTVTKELK